jgi:hypothetical protein
MQARVDQLTEAGRDIVISTSKGISENGWDRVGGGVNDARVTLKLITQPVIVIG